MAEALVVVIGAAIVVWRWRSVTMLIAEHRTSEAIHPSMAFFQPTRSEEHLIRREMSAEAFQREASERDFYLSVVVSTAALHSFPLGAVVPTVLTITNRSPSTLQVVGCFTIAYVALFVLLTRAFMRNWQLPKLAAVTTERLASPRPKWQRVDR